MSINSIVSIVGCDPEEFGDLLMEEDESCPLDEIIFPFDDQGDDDVYTF